VDSLQRAIDALHDIDREAEARGKVDVLHPLSRLGVTLCFIVVTVSFSKYDLLGLLSMGLFPLLTALYEDISLGQCWRRMRLWLIPLLCIGIANPFLDRAVLLYLGALPVTGGMLSLLTLLLKGVFAVTATYLLIVSVGIDGICRALRALRVPVQMVTMLLLIWRYLSVFLKEIQRMSQAYALRAPGQGGVHIRSWGSFVGLLLLRSIDRAGDVYHSMLLRGYDGNLPGGAVRRSVPKSVLYAALWCAAFFLLRAFPVFGIVGGLFTMF
jgi:cobalt/nickel transport system permease protein